MDFADVEMAEALADIPQEAKANVFKFDEADGKWPWVGVVTPSTANHEYFARRFGGGKFRARFRKPGGAWGKQFTIELDPTIRPEPDMPVATSEGRRSGSDDGDEDFRSLYKMELLDLIRSSREAREQSAAGTIGLMKMVMDMVSTSSASTATLIKSMTDVRQNAAPAPGLSTADVLKMVGDARKDALDLVNTVRGGGPMRGGPGGSVDSTLDLIERLGEIRERLDGGDAPKKEGGLFDKLLGDIVPLLLDVVKPALAAGARAQATAPVQPNAEPGAVAPRHAPVATIPAPAQEPAVPAAPLWLTFAKTAMLEAAQEGREPEEFALSIMDLAPKSTHGKIREFVMQENPVATIIAQAPELTEYPTWLAGLIVELRAQFTNPPEGGAAPADAAPSA